MNPGRRMQRMRKLVRSGRAMAIDEHGNVAPQTVLVVEHVRPQLGVVVKDLLERLADGVGPDIDRLGWSRSSQMAGEVHAGHSNLHIRARRSRRGGDPGFVKKGKTLEKP